MKQMTLICLFVLSQALEGLVPNQQLAYNNNTALINSALSKLQPGSTLVIPNNTFWVNGGIYGANLKNVVIQLEGTLIFQNSRHLWPTTNGKQVKEAILFENCENITFTSSYKYGLLDGNGQPWWGYINYLIHSENRPKLFRIENSAGILVENIFFKNSPYWTTSFSDVADVEIRYSKIEARRNSENNHDFWNLGAFNTDGFDVAGKNVWIHDVDVWNQDDCVCVKGVNKNGKRAQCAQNMLFENLSASGLGLTIGSIGASNDLTCVNNITFRNIQMPNTFKGIYVKSRPSSSGLATISNIKYENITIVEPEQWAIWIGPQQAIYSGACSLAYPTLSDYCPIPNNVQFQNITLKDVVIKNPKRSLFNLEREAGVILSNGTNPMKSIVFDNVKVENSGGYKCVDTDIQAIGGTSPTPCGSGFLRGIKW